MRRRFGSKNNYAMSARGARSRKVQQKDIDKKDKKVGKSKADLGQDGFADWRATPSNSNNRSGISRSITVSSRATSGSSGTNDSNHRSRLDTLYSSGSSEARSGNPLQSSTGGSASISDASTQGKEKTRFQAKGKETKAPRGRGGGVPIKRTVVPSPAPPLVFRAESSASYPSSNQKTWMNFKVWEGSKDGMRPYGGFEHVSF